MKNWTKIAAVIAVFFVGVLSAGVSARAAEPHLIIEDNDFFGPGGSDMQSVLPVLADPGVKVLGFTVATGDGWLKEETAHLLRFLEVAGITDIPVVRGAEMPLINTQKRMKIWEETYGKIPWKGAWNDPAPGMHNHPNDPDAIPDLPGGPAKLKPSSEIAANFLIRQVHLHPHQITILEAGPMTNLALAIRLDPSFASLAKELVFMGGLLDTNLLTVTGNANFNTDFNMIFDPEAAHIALTAPWARIVVVGNVSNGAMMDAAFAKRIGAKKTPVNEYLLKHAVLGLPLWDEMAAAIAVDPSLVTKQVSAFMDIDMADGPDYGRVHVWPADLRPHLGEQKVEIVQTIDTPRFLDGFVAAAQHDFPHAMTGPVP